MRILRRLLATPPDQELTQAELAKLVGVSLRTVRRWEEGYEVGAAHQRALMALGINAGWLVGRMQPVLLPPETSSGLPARTAHSEHPTPPDATVAAEGTVAVAVVLRTLERAIYAALGHREGRRCVYRLLLTFSEELRTLDLGNHAFDMKKAAERLRDREHETHSPT